MPTQKTLREIIIKLLVANNKIENGTFFQCYDVDSVISEIKSLLKEKLPKKREVSLVIDDETFEEVHNDQISYGNEQFNSCLTEIEKILEEV